jgi:hypothetical protein
VLFPNTQKFNRIVGSDPILNEMIRTVRLPMLDNIGQGNEVFVFLRQHSDGGALNLDGFLFLLMHPPMRQTG